jgi:hypothetical protein
MSAGLALLHFFFAHDRGRSPLKLHRSQAEGKQDETAQDLEAPVSS